MHELPEFDVYTPSTLREALSFLSAEGKGSKLLAGGTWLIPRMLKRGVKVDRLVDLSGLDELRYIRRAHKTIRIGGLTTVSDIASADILDGRYRCFRRLGHQFGVEATRNMATVAGNLAAAAEGDLVEIFHALDGQVIVQSARGKRTCDPLGLGLAEDEVIAEVRVAELEGRVSTWFNKFENRRENGTGSITTTTLVKLDDEGSVADVRIAVNRARERQIGRARLAESELKGRTPDDDGIRHALDTLESEISPAGDFRGSSRFRKQVTRALVNEGVTNCLQELGTSRKAEGI